MGFGMDIIEEFNIMEDNMLEEYNYLHALKNFYQGKIKERPKPPTNWIQFAPEIRKDLEKNYDYNAFEMATY